MLGVKVNMQLSSILFTIMLLFLSSLSYSAHLRMKRHVNYVWGCIRFKTSFFTFAKEVMFLPALVCLFVFP